MKRRVAVEWIKRNIDRYITVYGLDHWEIQVMVDDDPTGRIMGHCEASPKYENATITLYPGNIPNEAELHDTFCHELEHILHSPFDLFFQAALESAPEDAKPALAMVFDYAMERTRRHIGRLRKNLGLRPAPRPRKARNT